MAFQRSYSKVWWGSDNQLQALPSAAGTSLTSGGFYSYFSQPKQQQQQQQQFSGASGNTGYHSLDFNNFKSYSGNLSRIQEVDDEHNISKLSWEKHDSPGSLRSQDSGFSDNDESHNARSLGGRSTTATTTADLSAQSIGSPTSATQSIATPPTVVRRVGKSEFYSPLVNVSRRISFSGSPASGQTPKMHTDKQQQQKSEPETVVVDDGAELMAKLDSMHLVECVSTAKQLDFDTTGSETTSDLSPCKCAKDIKQRRRRRVSRKPTKPLSPTKRRTAKVASDNDSDDDDASSLDELETELNRTRTLRTATETVPTYNNETVYLGEAPPPYNNETVILGAGGVGGVGGESNAEENTNNNNNTTLKFGSCEDLLSPLAALRQGRYTASTSTPKAGSQKINAEYGASTTLPALLLPDCYEYPNPLLNGHSPALQHWLDDIRMSYEHEVMSTLQTKSIAQEAFKNLTITTNTVAKLIRQLQQRAMHMQSDFERIERILVGEQSATLAEALFGAEKMVDSVAEFTKQLERRAVFFTDSRLDRRRYEQNLEQMKLITKDTRFSLEKQHYINLESLLDDLHVLKRYLLIALRLLFEKLVRVIVQSIEQSRCDLMLRANINMIATLTNIDYEGFASLTDAFVQNEAVRSLLMVCLEHKESSVRALALRALATICCAPAAIAQLGSCGGIEIVRDILQTDADTGDALKRAGNMERREAVSLLTQITASWHGPEHRVDGLRDCAESIVQGLTELIAETSCAQTLLLCAAALNNLSRIEMTSHYSIMSNDAIFKMIETVEQRGDEVTIFLYEQIVAMLHNMSLNKKCHSHLANGSIINFITSIYQTEFYRVYDSRAQCDAQRRTIKSILHTLTRLVHESSLGPELLELQGMPVFLKSNLMGGASTDATQSADSSHSRDISLLARQLFLAQQQQRQEYLPPNAGIVGVDGAPYTMELAAAKIAEVSGGLKFNLTRQESYV